MLALKNYKTTLMGLSPLVPYALQYFGFWPAAIPLPAFETIWPGVMAALGLGVMAKDSDVTGGDRPQ